MNQCKYRNNPYNLRYDVSNLWKGQMDPKNGFCQFKTLEYGVRAAFITIFNYGNLHNLKTPREIINRWAPPEDGNDTKTYVDFVSQVLDVDVELSSTLEYVVLMYAMWQVEQGWTPSLFEFVHILHLSILDVVE